VLLRFRKFRSIEIKWSHDPEINNYDTVVIGHEKFTLETLISLLLCCW